MSDRPGTEKAKSKRWVRIFFAAAGVALLVCAIFMLVLGSPAGTYVPVLFSACVTFYMALRWDRLSVGGW
ncbi:hypothetical protein [Spirillospora sp. CA-128828]|uniref:hypothetical protein n=1 Tax=Spirillospora sp. CA-128828 TaxID=3240033 RepID=UPI003D8CBC15